MHLARRLAGTGTAGAGYAQSQCLHHHTRPQTGSAASQPDTHPETPPSTLCALHPEHSSLRCTSQTCLSCQPLSTLALLFGMDLPAMTSYMVICNMAGLNVTAWHVSVSQAQQQHQQQLDCLATHDLCIAWTDDTAAAHDKITGLVESNNSFRAGSQCLTCQRERRPSTGTHRRNLHPRRSPPACCSMTLSSCQWKNPPGPGESACPTAATALPLLPSHNMGCLQRHHIQPPLEHMMKAPETFWRDVQESGLVSSHPCQQVV